uniref:Uncharacterized protein n=1 Tax=Timema cristinae TaxID=61476 RepID=A0A7R9CHN0_TIMCR|nr:unnamed protein product [Timema cristinae]
MNPDLSVFKSLVQHEISALNHAATETGRDMSVKSLRYLSSEQALADLAEFIEAMNDKYKLTSATKWIVFGGSYPGSLAAWLRFKYPHLIHGAVSTSGPLLAKADFQEYYGVVQQSLSTTGNDCVRAIKNATSQIDILLKHEIGLLKLKELFRPCDAIDPTNEADVATLYETLAGNFAGVVQYNKDNRAFEGSRGTNITIDVVCELMSDETIGPAVTRYAAVNSLLLDAYNQTCTDFSYDNMIRSLRNTSWNSSASEGGIRKVILKELYPHLRGECEKPFWEKINSVHLSEILTSAISLSSTVCEINALEHATTVAGRQWIYQTCTEFGFYQTSSLSPHLFGDDFPLDYFTRQCEDIFGPSTYLGEPKGKFVLIFPQSLSLMLVFVSAFWPEHERTSHVGFVSRTPLVLKTLKCIAYYCLELTLEFLKACQAEPAVWDPTRRLHNGLFNDTLLEQGINRTNMFYGAYNLQVTNIVFVHGTIDPWHALGITKSISDSEPAIFIEGTAHCANMYPSSPDDPPGLVEARLQIFELVKRWLQ